MKISELPASTELASDDILPIVDTSASITKKATVADIVALVPESTPVTLDAESSSWLTLVGQVLKLTLVAAGNGITGVVTAAAQSFSGVKTFVNGLIASAAVTINASLTVAKPPVLNEAALIMPSPVNGSIYGNAGAICWGVGGLDVINATAQSFYINAYNKPINISSAFQPITVCRTGGLGASDVALQFGMWNNDADHNVSSRLVEFATGIGGTKSVKLHIERSGNVGIAGALAINGTLTGVSSLVAGGIALGTTGIGVFASSFNLSFGSGWGLTDDANAEAFRFITSTTFANVNASIMTWRNSNVFSTDPVARLRATGRLDQAGTDSSASPGNRTGANAINKPSGVSAIAAGATTCQIDNSLVTATSKVLITWYGDLGTQSKIPWVTRSAGSFTVNVGTAPAGAVAFGWEVSSLL